MKLSDSWSHLVPHLPASSNAGSLWLAADTAGRGQEALPCARCAMMFTLAEFNRHWLCQQPVMPKSYTAQTCPFLHAKKPNWKPRYTVSTTVVVLTVYCMPMGSRLKLEASSATFQEQLGTLSRQQECWLITFTVFTDVDNIGTARTACHLPWTLTTFLHSSTEGFRVPDCRSEHTISHTVACTETCI